MHASTKCLMLGILGCTFASNSVHAFETPIELPEQARTAWVSSSINHSGMLLSIKAFHSPDSVDDVLSFYRVLWFKEGDVPGFIEEELMDWKLISKKLEDENIVLQLKPTDQGGSTGFLSVAMLNGANHVIDHRFPLPDSTEEFAVTYSHENDSTVHTMTFITKQSISSTTSFYESGLARSGWSLARQDTVKGSSILLFNRGADRCELVIQALNGEDTVIYVNRVLHDA